MKRHEPALRPRFLTPRAPLLAVALAAVFAPAAPAVNPPHWTSPNRFSVDCTSQCHTGHHALGGTLTPSADNVNLCVSCHNPGDIAADLAIATADRSLPGVGGTSHPFEVAAEDATTTARGIFAPNDTEMSLRVMDGKVVCSTCHDQHNSTDAMGGTLKISTPKRTTAGTGGLVAHGTFTGTEAAWYEIKIVQASPALFQWRKYTETGGWTVFSSDTSAGTDVPLDDGVLVDMSGSWTLDERWEFYVAWPFLRAKLDAGGNAAGDKFCRDCHRGWVMDHNDVETYTGTPRSHPVGVALNANLKGYDRAAPLEADGGVDDSNPSNDLKLFDDGGGNDTLVLCLTCHGVHFADSNSDTQ